MAVPVVAPTQITLLEMTLPVKEIGEVNKTELAKVELFAKSKT